MEVATLRGQNFPTSFIAWWVDPKSYIYTCLSIIQQNWLRKWIYRDYYHSNVSRDDEGHWLLHAGKLQ